MRHRYNCGGFASYNGPCGATDCILCGSGYSGEAYDAEDQEEEATSCRVVTACKARFIGKSSEIKPGDRVQVTGGFTYTRGGARTGYLRKSYRRVSKGPAWSVEENSR